MSYVQNIIVITAYEDTVVQELDAWLVEEQQIAPRSALVQVDQYAGGIKAFEADVWVGACNYLKIDAFVKFVKRLKVKSCYPESFQVFLRDEDEDNFVDVEQR